jgi:hypothetical protein
MPGRHWCDCHPRGGRLRVERQADGVERHPGAPLSPAVFRQALRARRRPRSRDSRTEAFGLLDPRREGRLGVGVCEAVRIVGAGTHMDFSGIAHQMFVVDTL